MVDRVWQGRFALLGQLTVSTDDGRPVRVPEAKVRALLAVLLLHRGEPVPVARLLDELWRAQLPGNPANRLQTDSGGWLHSDHVCAGGADG